MDIKLKNYSHLLVTKITAFIMVVLCFTGVVATSVNLEVLNDGYFSVVFEDDYFHSKAYIRESENVIFDLKWLMEKYKNKEYILSGRSITEAELRSDEESLYSEFRVYSKSYKPELDEEKNYEKFKEEYTQKLTQARDRRIREDLREYNLLLKRMEEYKGLFYYATDGANIYANSANRAREQFKAYPSYMIFENYDRDIFPQKVNENENLYLITHEIDKLDQESSAVYIAFSEELLSQSMKKWKDDKAIASASLYRMIAFLAGFLISFVYLVIVIGRKSFKDQELHLNAVDRLFNDVKLVLCILLIVMWAGLIDSINLRNVWKFIIPITIPAATIALIFVLTIVKNFKNKTLLKNTLIYTVFYKIFKFVGDVYNSGSVGVKIVLLVVGYPILAVLTFFIFPITLGAAAWITLRRVKAFNAIKEGVERIKAGDLQHVITVKGSGEYERLAANINSIADGLKNAVDNELKSERLKTELITNVSHDIRTPLTSIITYVDLLKNEKDPAKVGEYVAVLEQKSQRLKILTDDLFEAAKASSGSIPVNLERIDIVSLITQGLGELDDKIEASDLDFKINHPKAPVYITADGKLLWRSIENLLSNIFKYALKGSRVYIDIEDLGNEVLFTVKNISAYELNIKADELMERFKRGDESRSSQGSGLGLSIAKSLIDAQRGRFSIQIDGDLFKAMVYMPKHKL
ncbi:MAG: HAMP domain-containing histidine kinase [Clostridia bacterium]|nr:HAMP domain-containing histidine kinase [Clostridia bacterium]